MKSKATKALALALIGSSIIWASSEKPEPISDQVVQGYMALMKAQDAKTIYSLVEKETKKSFTVDALSSLLGLQKRLYGKMKSYTYKGETITGSKKTTISAEVKDCFKKSDGLYKLKFVRGKRDKDFYLTKFYFTPADTQRFDLVDSIIQPFLTQVANQELDLAYEKSSSEFKKTTTRGKFNGIAEVIRKSGIGPESPYKTHSFLAFENTLASEIHYLQKTQNGNPIMRKFRFILKDQEWCFAGLGFEMQW